MVKFSVLVICAIIAVVVAEPPSSYLPPQARNAPSSVYGSPFGDFRSNGRNGNNGGKSTSFHAQRTGSKSFSYNSLHENQFGSFLPKSFGNGGTQFGSSNRFGSSKGFSSNNGFSSSGFNSKSRFGASNGFGLSRPISQQYGAPGQTFRASGSNFGSNGHGVSNVEASQQYRPSNFESSSRGFDFSRSGISLTSGFSKNAGNGFAVSQSYKPPNLRSFSGFESNSRAGFEAPSPIYGVPSFRSRNGYSKMNDDLAEPANYDFTYEVQAAEESGAEFGHQESREDESAKGVYHVLLPDGRTQIVEYEADDEGFRPQIRYEEPSGYGDARSAQGPY